MTSPSAPVTVAAWTHVGLVRRRNEDAIALPGLLVTGQPPRPLLTTLPTAEAAGGVRYLVAVIDGMGGHVGGAEASRLVGSRLAHGDGDGGAIAALGAANEELYDVMDQRPDLRSMGATVVAAQLAPGCIEVCNVGDARAYTHVDGYATLVSVDDRSASGSGELTQSLGGANHRTRVSVHRSRLPLEHRLRLLLCSDGLSDCVGFRELEDALDEPDAGSAVERLVDLALRAGAPDNVSVVILDWPGSGGGP